MRISGRNLDLNDVFEGFRTLARQTHFALRSSIAICGRLLTTIAAGVGVWCTIFISAEKIAEFEDATRARSNIDGFPAYRLSIQRQPHESDQITVQNMPHKLVDKIRSEDYPGIFFLRKAVRVSNPSREKVFQLDAVVLNHSDTKNAATDSRAFAPCYLVGAPGLDAVVGSILPIGDFWRCRLTASPAALSISTVSAAHPLVVFGVEDADTYLGDSWDSAIESMIVGIRDPEQLQYIKQAFRQFNRATLKVDRISDLLPTTATELADSAKSFKTYAKLWLSLALTFYMQGGWPAARREAALRACIGQHQIQVWSWFTWLIAVQSFIIAYGSWLLAIFSYAIYRNMTPQLHGTDLLGPIALWIILLSTMASGILVLILFRKSMIHQWLR